jgi:hypothetical protein
MNPELKVHSYDRVEALNPVSVAELTNWLTSAAYLKTADLEEKVKQFHYVECTDHQRLELLDWIRPLITNTAYSVRSAIAGGDLPLADHIIADIDTLGRINATMADLYKATILSLASSVLKNQDSSYAIRSALHEDLVLACYGAIYFLAEQLRSAYEGYRPIPEGIWEEIHHVYNYARFIIGRSETAGVDGEKVNDEFFLIEHIYKKSLLLGLCNPYHFPVVAFGELNRTLNKWAHLCKIERNVKAPTQHCMFSIDAESDFPAAPVFSHSGELATSERYSVLNTADLIAALNQEIDMMGQLLHEQQGTREVPAKSLILIEMLRRLIMNWGKHPVRQDVRQNKDGKCETVPGYDNIMNSMGGMVTAALKKQPLEEGRCCIIRDASDKGMQVEMDPTQCKMNFRIGDMIAVRDSTRPEVWSLSVVRWARYTQGKNIRVGMFIMGEQAERYKLQLDLSSDKTVDVMSVIGTSNFPVDKKILLAPMGVYRPGRIMLLTGGDSQRIIARNLIMSGADFDVFDFNVAS